MGERRIDPRKQFSKWLARWTSVFWFFYMTLLAVICFVQPNAAESAVYLAIISSVVMLANVGAYTKNSIYEKAILAGMDIKKIKLSLKPKETEDDGSCDEEDDNETDDGEEGEG